MPLATFILCSVFHVTLHYRLIHNSYNPTHKPVHNGRMPMHACSSGNVQMNKLFWMIPDKLAGRAGPDMEP